jgi:hypothetical protein
VATPQQKDAPRLLANGPRFQREIRQIFRVDVLNHRQQAAGAFREVFVGDALGFQRRQVIGDVLGQGAIEVDLVRVDQPGPLPLLLPHQVGEHGQGGIAVGGQGVLDELAALFSHTVPLRRFFLDRAGTFRPLWDAIALLVYIAGKRHLADACQAWKRASDEIRTRDVQLGKTPITIASRHREKPIKRGG